MNLHGGRAWARLGACTAAAIVAAGFVGFTSVAYAASGSPDLSVKVPGAALTLDSAGKFVRVDIANLGNAPATHVQVTLSSTDGDAVTATPVSVGCTLVAKDTVCDAGTLNPGESVSNDGFLVELNLNPKAKVAAGSQASLTVNVSESEKDANPKDNTVTVPVTIAPSGVDMVAYASDVRDVPPGATAELDWAVKNMGGVAVSDFTVNVAVPEYVAIQDNPGCTVASDRRTAKCGGIAMPASTDHIAFLSTPMMVTVAPNAPGPVSLGFGEVSVAGVAATSSGPKALAKTSRYQLKTNTNGLKSGADDSVPGDNTVQFAVTTTANAADLEVTATPVSGGVGSTVQVPVTVRDNGPVDVLGAKLHITAPSGTQVVDADVLKFCTAVKKGVEYWCNGGGLQVGQPEAFTIAFKITSATVGSNGTLVISGPQPDPVKTNNTAKIVITVGQAAGLPITGTKTGLIGGIGGALLIAGVTLWLINRRRRVILVTPRDGS